MAPLIDTHAHLNHHDFRHDLSDVLVRAREAGVTRVIVPGYDLPSSERAVELAALHDEIFAAVGVHPHDAKTLDDAALARISELAGRNKVVAIGEIGLDFHYDFSPREQQIEAFEKQLRLAVDLRMPVVVHTRGAETEVLQALEAAPGLTGVMHHFVGDGYLARRAVELGLLLGIAGPITYKNREALRETVRGIDLTHLVVETDCPYASPEPLRGRRNEPAYVTYVASRLAELKGCSSDESAAVTTANAAKAFALESRPQAG